MEDKLANSDGINFYFFNSKIVFDVGREASDKTKLRNQTNNVYE